MLEPISLLQDLNLCCCCCEYSLQTACKNNPYTLLQDLAAAITYLALGVSDTVLTIVTRRATSVPAPELKS